jgi:hypothetical protein
VGALVTGDLIEIKGYGNVEVTGITRDPWRGSPVYVTHMTPDGSRTVPLSQVEIVP